MNTDDNKTYMAILIVASLLFAGSMGMIQNAGAATFGTDIRVNDSAFAASTQSAPDMAIGPNGNIYIVWEDNRNGNYDIYLSSSADGGSSFSTDVLIDNDGANQQRPAVVTYGTSNVYVVWQDFRNGNWDIYFARSSNGGASFGTPVLVSDAGGSSEQSYPDIAVAGNDNIYVVWQDFRNGNWDIYSAVSTDDGNSFDQNVRVNSNPSPVIDQESPSVAVNDNDDIFVVWQDDRNGDDDIFLARSTNDGDSYQTEIEVSNDDTNRHQRSPTIAIDDSNDIYVVYDDYRSGNSWDIYISTSINNGNSFDAHARVNDASSNDLRMPSITVDAADNLHIAWYNDWDNYIYYTKSTDAGVSFGYDTRVSSTNGAASFQYPPAVVVNNAMEPYVAWADSRNGNDDIYFSNGINNGPACSISYPAADSTVSGTLSISGSASDPDGDEELVRVEVRIDGGDWNTASGTSGWSYAINTNSLSNDRHTIYARSFDGVLYSSIDSISIYVNNPSNLAPLVSIWTPVSNSALSGSEAVIAGNATDPDGDFIDFVQVKIDGGDWNEARGMNNWAAWAYSLDTTTLSNGQHTVYARSYDGALYSDISSVFVLVSNTGGNSAPVISIEEPVENEHVTENYIIRGIASDPNGDIQIERVQIRLDNGSWEDAIPVVGQNNWTTWVYYLDISDMPLGEHLITARAYDGMDYSVEDSVTVMIAEPDGGNGMLWLLAIIILFLILLLLLVLLKNRKDKPTQFQPAVHPYQEQGAFAPQQGMPPQHPSSDIPPGQAPPPPPPEG